MRVPIAACLGLVLIAPSACKPDETGPMPICASEVEGGEAEETQSANVPPEVWFTLILKSFNPKTGEPARPTKDCTNKPIEIEDEQLAACLLPENPPAALPPRPMTGDEDLEIVGIDDGKALVWVRTEYYENGDALGPIAMAEFRKNGIAIRAIGPLRANPNRIRLRLEPFGETTALVAESMVCPPDDPKKCTKVLRLLTLDGGRFVERPLQEEETGACLGPATFALSHDEEISREDGTIRRFELVRTVDFEEGTITINEQVTIKDIDPKQPDLPPAVFRKAQIKRPLVIAGSGLQTTPELWDRVMAEHGSVRVRPDKPAEGAAPAEGEDAAAG